MGLHVKIREKLWQTYRLVHPATFNEAEQSSRVNGAISNSRNKLLEMKARQVFEEECRRKRSGYQKQLEKTVQKLWKQDRRLRNTEKRISDAKALLKELKAKVAATTSGHREVFEQYNRSCREWQAEETRMERVNKAIFHQDRPPRPLKLPDLPPSVLPLKEATRRLAGSQKTSTAQLTSAEEFS